MKVMAVGTLEPLTPQQQETYMPTEVPATLQLYLDGKMEQFWRRADNHGVIFLMSTQSVDEAEAVLKALPLTQAGIMKFELYPLTPLSPLGMLIPPAVA